CNRDIPPVDKRKEDQCGLAIMKKAATLSCAITNATPGYSRTQSPRLPTLSFLSFRQINTAFVTLAVEPVNVLSRISDSDPFRRFAAATGNKKLPKHTMFKQGLHRWWQRSNGLFGSHTWFAEIGAHAVLQQTRGVNAWRRHKHRNQ